MRLGGLMKTTLLDFPGQVACTVFTQGCNLRCPFCHNASLVSQSNHDSTVELSDGDFFSFLETRKNILDGVVVSGGEPLMQNDIEIFLEKIRSMGFRIKLDTNGTYPDKLRSVVENGLVDYVAMDIKNSPQKYISTTGSAVENNVNESIHFLLNSSSQYEFRTTAVSQLHTVDDFIKISTWISGAKQYYIQRFEDSGNILGKEQYTSPTEDELKKFLMAAQQNIPHAMLRGI